MKALRSLRIKEALGYGVVCKMPVLGGTPWEAGSSPGRLRELSEIFCNGAFGSAPAPEDRAGEALPQAGCQQAPARGCQPGAV